MEGMDEFLKWREEKILSTTRSVADADVFISIERSEISRLRRLVNKNHDNIEMNMLIYHEDMLKKWLVERTLRKDRLATIKKYATFENYIKEKEEA